MKDYIILVEDLSLLRDDLTLMSNSLAEGGKVIIPKTEVVYRGNKSLSVVRANLGEWGIISSLPYISLLGSGEKISSDDDITWEPGGESTYLNYLPRVITYSDDEGNSVEHTRSSIIKSVLA